jgi:hypothetical protein
VADRVPEAQRRRQRRERRGWAGAAGGGARAGGGRRRRGRALELGRRGLGRARRAAAALLRGGAGCGAFAVGGRATVPLALPQSWAPLGRRAAPSSRLTRRWLRAARHARSAAGPGPGHPSRASSARHRACLEEDAAGAGRYGHHKDLKRLPGARGVLVAGAAGQGRVWGHEGRRVRVRCPRSKMAADLGWAGPRRRRGRQQIVRSQRRRITGHTAAAAAAEASAAAAGPART